VTSALATVNAPLATREGLRSYDITVRWDEQERWRRSVVLLPDGRSVAIDSYVGANLQRPRQFHPEYAAAIELIVANAVVEAKRRGFRVAAVELGVWAYRTLTTLGKRITKVGLAEPIKMEDGRTETYTAYAWVDHEGEGVLLLPWPNGDQLIRIKDDRGQYVVPVDERTADASQCRQAQSWRHVQDYPVLRYPGSMPWQEVPLLESADPMVVQIDCEACHVLAPVGTHVKDRPSGQRVCADCKVELARVREQAASQGWDYDKKRPIKRTRPFDTIVNPAKCAHRWGMQMRGPAGEMRISWECILCGKPTPASELSEAERAKKSDHERAVFERKRKA
jgi:hypothetical protein